MILKAQTFNIQSQQLYKEGKNKNIKSKTLISTNRKRNNIFSLSKAFYNQSCECGSFGIEGETPLRA
jgi:hypothetical protein